MRILIEENGTKFVQLEDHEKLLEQERQEGYIISACYERALNELLLAHNVLEGYLKRPSAIALFDLMDLNSNLKQKLKEEGRL